MTQEELSLLTRYRQKRDAEAFRELVTLHKDMVYAACHRILGNAADAEDAAQNCFLAFARTPERVKKSVGGWLHRVAVGTAIDHLRQEKARKERESRAVQEQGSSESVEWDRVAPAIDKAINELPENLRIPIVRYYLEGQKQEQVAQELNVTHSAVSKRLQRGTEALRGRLTKAGVALSVAALASLLSANAAEAAPVALTATLGKMALANLGTAGKSATFGGAILMKVGIAIILVAASAMILSKTLSGNDNLNIPTADMGVPSDPVVPDAPSKAPSLPSTLTAEESAPPQIYSQRVALWAAALTDAGAEQVRQFSSPLVLKQGEEKWREQNLGGGFALQCDAKSLVRFIHEGLNAQETAISETVYWFGEMRTPGHDQPSFEDIRYCRLLEGGWGGYNTKIAGEHVWGSFIMSGAYWMKAEETGIKIRLCFESLGSAVEHIDKLPLGTCWLFLLPTKPPGLPAGMSQGIPWHLYVIHAVGLTEAEEREIVEKMNILHRTGGQAFIELLNTSDHTTVQDQTDTQVP